MSVAVIHFRSDAPRGRGLTRAAPQVSTRFEPTVPAAAMNPEVRTLRHEVDFDAAPQTVFDALMDEAQHAAFTGYEASIDWREGGRFVTCGERNFGYTLVLVPGQRIVQAWSHKSFPQHQYSVVTFELEPRGQGTRLTFTQTGAPADAYEWLDEGWKATYWEPLKRYLREVESAA